jgi:hypothetical protein
MPVRSALRHHNDASMLVGGAGEAEGSRVAPDRKNHIQERGKIMLYTIAVVLLILWVLGLVTSTTIGGFIHILLVVAVVMVLVKLISGRGI